MAYNEELALRIRVALDGHDGVAEKKMFGGIAFMLDGNMCVGVTGDDLMVRVGPGGSDAALAQPHARPMDFTGRPMKGFVYVGSAGTEKDDSLTQWVQLGVAFARTLPAKRVKPNAKRFILSARRDLDDNQRDTAGPGDRARAFHDRGSGRPG